jgi:hypothetical protein
VAQRLELLTIFAKICDDATWQAMRLCFQRSQSISAATSCCGKHGSHLCSDCGVLAFPCLIRASRRPVDDTSLAIHGIIKRSRKRAHSWRDTPSWPNAPDPQDILVLGMRAPTYRRNLNPEKARAFKQGCQKALCLRAVRITLRELYPQAHDTT